MGRTATGRTGPCYHCGTYSTPLWRQGPPEKPVLCNACGSRYRLKGTLENYVPKIMNNRNFQAGQNLNILNKDSSDGSNKSQYSAGIESEFLSNKNFQGRQNIDPLNKDLSEGTSGTGSRLTSSSTSSAGIDPKSLWDVPIPSRERAQLVYKEMTPTETFHRQLLNVQKSEEQPADESEDDVLIYCKWHFIPSNEIGLGCMLLDPADLATSSSQKKSPKQA